MSRETENVAKHSEEHSLRMGGRPAPAAGTPAAEETPAAR
jgi:hypothetical protein